MATRSSKCKTCGTRTTASAGYCQRCKSLRHHGYKRVKEENLVVDQAGGAWWIWDARGDVLVAGKPTRDAAILALGAGDVEEDAEETHAMKKTRTSKQLDQEIEAALNRTKKREATQDARKKTPPSYRRYVELAAELIDRGESEATILRAIKFQGLSDSEARLILTAAGY